MRILIVTATESEIEPLLKRLSFTGEPGGVLKEGKYKKLKVDILITGVGMVSTAYYCAKTISRAYDCAINAGIAGSFRNDIPVGTVVNVAYDRFSELGAEAEEKFLTIKEMGLNGTDSVDNTLSIKNREVEELKKVRGVTVNTVHGNRSSIEKVIAGFNPDVETMEGAAFLFVCKEEGIPCAQIRAVSNFVEPRNKESWNIPLAVKNLDEKITGILERF